MTERKGRRVKILHDQVGPHARGKIVYANEFDDVDRLIGLGAVEYTDEDPEPMHPTLSEAMRSESPPTLPNAPYVVDDQKEVQRAAGMVPPEQPHKK